MTHHAEHPPKVSGQSGGSMRDRGPRLSTLLVMLALFVVALIVGAAFSGSLRSGYSQAKAALLDLDRESEGGSGEGGDRQYYTCGMHPWIVLPEPGDCPVCQMDLVPIDPAKFTGEIAIDPVVVQNMGIRVEAVTTGPVTRSIRTVGSIEYDERHIRDVNVKVAGWIEELHADHVGQSVERGQPIFELYSPQLYQAQEEYLIAWRGSQRGGAESHGETAGASMLRSARTRLEYFDITEDQIEALRQRGQAAKTMTIRSPHRGTVIEKHAHEGMKIDSGMRVYRIADLSKVWVMVTLYEQQLPYVMEGQEATMRLSYVPDRTFEGRVIQVYPFMESGTRQAKVRLEFDNPDGLLKPGMYANVELKGTLAEEAALAPRSAIIDTGQRQVAFVSLGGGKFEPRDVKLGAETDGDRVQVLEGLEPGEKVVISGQFLLDSEARMREALVKMIEGEMAAEQAPETPVAGEPVLDDLPADAVEHLTAALDAYFAIGQALAVDSTDNVAHSARRLAASMERLAATEIPDRPHFWHEREERVTAIGRRTQALAEAETIEDARFRYAEVSDAFAALVEATGVPGRYGQTVEKLRCPMFPDTDSSSVWLQPAGDARNPFMGQRMPGCFDQRLALPTVGGDAPAASEESEPAIPDTPAAPDDGNAGEGKQEGEQGPSSADSPGDAQDHAPTDGALNEVPDGQPGPANGKEN